jgi:hypothetical protein
MELAWKMERQEFLKQVDQLIKRLNLMSHPSSQLYVNNLSSSALQLVTTLCSIRAAYIPVQNALLK